jgi:hypothetical protein
MMLQVDPVETKIVISELATLSGDPALATRPDPTFCPKFRNADEVIDNDFGRFDLVSDPAITLSPTWTGTTLWRRSSKE